MGYTDRTAKQKGYLGQKAIVRYLMQSITDRGGADALAQYLTQGHDVEHGFKNRTGDNEYDPEGFFGKERMQKSMAPWANRTEVALITGSYRPPRRGLAGWGRQGPDLVVLYHGPAPEGPGTPRSGT